MAEFFKIREVAREFGITPPAVLNMIKRGQLPGYKIGSRWMVKKSDLKEYVGKAKHKFENETEKSEPTKPIEQGE